MALVSCVVKGDAPPQQLRNYFYADLYLCNDMQVYMPMNMSTPYMQQQMNFSLSTMFTENLIQSSSCPGDQCLGPDKFNCDESETCVVVEQETRYSLHHFEGTQFVRVLLLARKMLDSMSVRFKSTLLDIETQIYSYFLAIDQVEEGASLFDNKCCSGILSISPDYYSNQTANKQSLLYHLKTNKKISQKVLGIQLAYSTNKNSRVKFGGWDKKYIKDMKDPVFIRTNGIANWKVPLS